MSILNNFFDVFIIDPNNDKTHSTQKKTYELNSEFFENFGSIPTKLYAFNKSVCNETSEVNGMVLIPTDFIICKNQMMGGWLFDQLHLNNLFNKHVRNINVFTSEYSLNKSVGEVLVIRRHLSQSSQIMSGLEYLMIELLSDRIKEIYTNHELTNENKIKKIEMISFIIPETSIQIKLLQAAFSSAQVQKEMIETHYLNWRNDKIKFYQELENLTAIKIQKKD